MPLFPPTPVANQVGPNGLQPYVNQYNYGQTIGAVSSWATHAPIPMIQNWINDAVRAYYDRRNWYGLYAKGQIVTPGYYSAGTVTCTQGSTTVTGTGTGWTASLGGQPIIGQALRLGFQSPIYNIVGFNPGLQQLTLELPWGNPTVTTSGYFITQYLYSIPNIRYITTMKNLQMMFRMRTGMSQTLLDTWDPSRLQMFYSRAAATAPPDAAGNYVVELWPVQANPQAFPYMAYVQPPNLIHDTDNFPAYIRGDIVLNHAISTALMYRPKSNPHYSESMCLQLSAQKMKLFEGELLQAERADENLFRQDVLTWAESMPMVSLDPINGQIVGGGGMLAAMSPVDAGGYY